VALLARPRGVERPAACALQAVAPSEPKFYFTKPILQGIFVEIFVGEFGEELRSKSRNPGENEHAKTAPEDDSGAVAYSFIFSGLVQGLR
jgi:hypothetical protein